MILIPCGKCHKINAKLAQMFICVPPAGCYKSVGHARWWTCSEENGADFFHRRCRRRERTAPSRPLPGPRRPRPPTRAARALPLLRGAGGRSSALCDRGLRSSRLRGGSTCFSSLRNYLKKSANQRPHPPHPDPKSANLSYSLPVFFFFFNHSGFSFKQTKTPHN